VAVAAAAILFLALAGTVARSETARIIKIIVPLAPGGPGDLLARLLADEIGQAHGATLIVENRPGAGTVVGAEAVSRAKPDGNTLLLTSTPFVISPHFRKLSYDPLTSFEPICHLVRVPLVIAVKDTSPYRSIADLLGAARARPGEVTVAGTGPASVSQIGFEMLKHAANVKLTFVPFPGAAPTVNALLGQHVQAALLDYGIVAEQLRVGKLRALATTSLTRIETLPDVPTVAETGYKDYEAELWFGMVAPARTPKETLAQLTTWFAAAIQVPEIRAKLVTHTLYPVGSCGMAFGNLLRKQYDTYGQIIREMNITME
jgi:tripartite-type tricarboxylate transporter receptor subunit TctC